MAESQAPPPTPAAPASATASLPPDGASSTVVKQPSEKDKAAQDKLPSFAPFVIKNIKVEKPSINSALKTARQINMLRLHSSKPWKPPLNMAPPRNTKICPPNLTRYAKMRQEKCLRRYTNAISARLETMSRPPVRAVISLWRDHQDTLAPEVINRFRQILHADTPMKTDDAYALFKCMKSRKKLKKKLEKTRPKPDKFEWQCHHGSRVSKNHQRSGVKPCMKSSPKSAGASAAAASRAGAAGTPAERFKLNISLRLARALKKKLTPLSDVPFSNITSKRLSNIVLANLRRLNQFHIKDKDIACSHPKARFLVLVSNKITLWINEIMEVSEDRMLFMDVDDDEEFEQNENLKLKPSESTSAGDESGKGKPGTEPMQTSSPPSRDTSPGSPKASVPGEAGAESPKAGGTPVSSPPGETSSVAGEKPVSPKSSPNGGRSSPVPEATPAPDGTKSPPSVAATPKPETGAVPKSSSTSQTDGK